MMLWDVLVPDTAWDELIVDRATRAGFASFGSCRSGQFVQVKRIRDEVSTEAAGDDARVSRAWKLFLLLHKPCGGLIPKGKLKERFNLFTQGRWEDLSQLCDADALKASSCRRRTQQGDSVEKRADRALDLVQMGELSAARHALEGDPIAPGNRQTLNALQDPERRPLQFPGKPSLRPSSIIFLRRRLIWIRTDSCEVAVSTPRAAGGPSGMTAEHIKVVLESERVCSSLWRMCQEFARGHMPAEILAVRIGRMTALQKPQGGIRGIVVGDFIRCVVARTLAQQLSPAVEQHTSLFQFASVLPTSLKR